MADASESHKYRVFGIEAFLYYHETGEVDSNNILDPSYALWNTIIGAGDATGASRTVLITAGVSGPLLYDGTVVLDFIMKEDTMTIASGEVDVSMYFRGKRVFYVPLLAYNVGCSPLIVTVSTKLNDLETSTMSDTIPFECGE